MDGKQQCKIRPQDQAAHSIWSLYEWRFQRYGRDKIVAEKKEKKKKKKKKEKKMNSSNPIKHPLWGSLNSKILKTIIINDDSEDSDFGELITDHITDPQEQTNLVWTTWEKYTMIILIIVL